MGLKKEKKNQMESKKKKKQYMIKIEIRKKGKKIAQFRLIHSHFTAFYCSKWFQEFTVGTDGSSGFT